MKKGILSFVVLILVISMVLPVFAQDGQKKVSIDNEIQYQSSETKETDFEPVFNESLRESPKARPETLALIETAIPKLIQGLVFSYFIGDFSLESMYQTAKLTAPEILELETKTDAALALIELYEDLLIEVRAYDFEKYYTEGKTILQDEIYDSQQKSDYFKRGSAFLEKREAIEGLLAVECYYNLLNEQDQLRMLADFEEFTQIKYTAAKKVFGEASSGTMFDAFRSLLSSNSGYENINQSIPRNSSNEYRDGNRDSPAQINYNQIGPSVYTTSGNEITTRLASRALTNDEILQCQETIEDWFPNVTCIAVANSYYNCHSFAWHSTTPTTKWISNDESQDGNTLYGVERYLIDNHCTYLGISDNIAQIGDIIVYYNYSLQAPVAHSGIVIGTNPILIQSKWGLSCVVNHSKADVPEAYKNSGSVSAKYFRYTREHDYTYTQYNSVKHRATCSVCGYSKLEAHYYMLEPDICDFCGYIHTRGDMFDGEIDESSKFYDNY